MTASSATDPLGRGPWWRLTSLLVTVVFGLTAWVYFFVLNRTRIVRPYIGENTANLMFVSNHQSPFDTALITLAAFFPRVLFCPRLQPWSAAAAEYWFRHRVIAWIADRLRCLPARTGRRDRTTVRRLCRAQPGGVTVFFPEGERSCDGTIGEGKAGAGFVALESRAQIVPVAINGLLAAMPYHRPWPHVGRRFTVAFGDPVPYDDLAAASRTRQAAQAIVDRSLTAVKCLYRTLTVAPTEAFASHRATCPGFAGKVVWVTGASSGIGRALALALHRTSATLVISSRNRAALDGVAAECTGRAPVHVVPLDLTDASSISDAVRSVMKVAGHVDYLFHNAGLAARAPAIELGAGVHRRVMETNYFGPVALTKAILPSMVARKSGTFVVVSSIVGRFGVARMAAYSASKHALDGYFESLRAEVLSDNIRVAIVMPGFINTAITVNALTGAGGRYGRHLRVHLDGMSPEECARRMLAGVASGRSELLIGGVEIWGVRLLRISRRLVAFLVRSHPFRVQQAVRRWFLRGDAPQPAAASTRENIPVTW